jgi:hypothetical protein
MLVHSETSAIAFLAISVFDGNAAMYVRRYVVEGEHALHGGHNASKSTGGGVTDRRSANSSRKRRYDESSPQAKRSTNKSRRRRTWSASALHCGGRRRLRNLSVATVAAKPTMATVGVGGFRLN